MQVALSCVLLITVMIVTFALDKAYPSLLPNFDACAEKGDECTGPIVLVTPPMTILRALPLFVFSYTCHQVPFDPPIQPPTHPPTVAFLPSARPRALAAHAPSRASASAPSEHLLDHQRARKPDAHTQRVGGPHRGAPRALHLRAPLEHPPLEHPLISN